MSSTRYGLGPRRANSSRYGSLGMNLERVICFADNEVPIYSIGVMDMNL